MACGQAGDSWPCGCPCLKTRNGRPIEQPFSKRSGSWTRTGIRPARLDAVKQADVVRLTHEDWQNERDRMIEVCEQCHSGNLVRAELEKGDEMIREADRLLAFHDAPSVIEQRLFKMHLEHRMRAFQGVFHNNPDYALWYGWSEMLQDLTEIKTLAQEMRNSHKATARSPFR